MADLALYYQELVSGKRTGFRDRLLLGALRLASYPYACLMGQRALAYRMGIFRSHRLPRPVIAVGNLTMGGTGKTPMVAHLAAQLIADGKRVVVLTRGYGGSAGKGPCLVSDGKAILVTPEVSGDEPSLLARKVPGLMVVVGSDRYRCGLFAMEKLQPDVFILDDGYQHLRLQRDLNLLLMDARNPLGNGRVIPAGFLREPRSAAKRADVVVYTRCAAAGEPNLFPGKPACWTTHSITGYHDVILGTRLGPAELQGKRIVAFSGIADPKAFFDLIETGGVSLTATISFADHASYGEEEIAAINRVRVTSRSTVLITTEKDAVKLAPFVSRLGTCLTADLAIRFYDESPLAASLEKILY
ncbi:tetraacyldisaccharide 4'-kinase [Geomesophilobacter sediminis]|uniref:Tetraacyldisaccharide 4'-kinase n=1 Tax=Geomesophilobacter sediminis TaxID=2798584 RepID=A0A8J7LVU6_9BACT|nr:tetraacyldisaccharide 4'-kinase [Geomesophilobacter sediminis]MBJ6725954.1 tetraacyldisaccharide 4'-kinase [Geomesophilobacter sediminis]